MGKPAKGRPRTASRVAAVQALFQSEQTGETVETIVDQFVRHRLGELPGSGGFEEGRVPDADVKLFARIVRQAVQDQDALDRLVSDSLPPSNGRSPGWTRCCGRCFALPARSWAWRTGRRCAWC